MTGKNRQPRDRRLCHPETKGNERTTAATPTVELANGLKMPVLRLGTWPLELCFGLAGSSNGTSNFKPSHLQRLLEVGLAPHVNQIQLNPEHVCADIRELHRQNDVVTGTYSPLGRGGSFPNEPAITVPAAKHGKTPSQIVRRWHTQQGITTAAKSASPQRQRENLDIFDFEQTQTEIFEINSLDTRRPARLDADEYAH